MEILPLDNVIQEYPWGSIDDIPNLLGYQNADKIPQAEVWMGTHPNGESHVVAGNKREELSRYIHRDLVASLGKNVAHRYGTLPFLFKALAAAQPLSIQAHPSQKHAISGFNSEEKLGIPIDAPYRNYKDKNHKPEIIVSLTPFTGMCGFRSMEKIADFFTAMECPFPYENHRSFFEYIIQLKGMEKEEVLRKARNYCEKVDSLETQWVLRLLDCYPDDQGSLAPFYLNLVELAPGEGIFLDAGVLHAYLEGFGMELMANSDNVLRGGLTPKHKDIQELLRTLLFRETKIEKLHPYPIDSWRSIYLTSAEEFRLEKWDINNNVSIPIEHPVSIAMVIDGEVSTGTHNFKKGNSFFIPHDCEKVILTGNAKLFVAVGAQ